jgi:5'(3')-deoxyribonucleotidase
MFQGPMINPATVAFDFDGVIADTMTLFLDIARSEYHIEGIGYEDITCYSVVECVDIEPEIVLEISSKIVAGEYRHPLKIYEGACDVLSRLAGCHNPLLFVTARPYPGPLGDWVRENIALDSHQVEVVATGSFEDKAAVLVEKEITHFVEDRLETCVAIQESGIVPVLYKQPWNRQPHRFLEVGNWAELARLIDFS